MVAITTNVKHYQHMSKNHQSAREILQLERYFPYRLSILSNRISALISETSSAKFALSITEWRIMAVLGEYPGISADEVSLKTQIEKSILSRAISKLLQRKLLLNLQEKMFQMKLLLQWVEKDLIMVKNI